MLRKKFNIEALVSKCLPPVSWALTTCVALSPLLGTVMLGGGRPALEDPVEKDKENLVIYVEHFKPQERPNGVTSDNSDKKPESPNSPETLEL